MDDSIHLGFVYALDGAAIIANLVLIGVVARRTPKMMKSYSIFLLNNAIIDLASALTSILIVPRIVCLPDHRQIMIYLGRCSEIGGVSLCYICHSLQLSLVNGSTAILLLSFTYRHYIIRSDTAYIKPPSRKIIWALCLLAYCALSHLWFLFYTSFHEKGETIEDNLKQFENDTIAWIYIFDKRIITFATVVTIFSPTATALMFYQRKSLIIKISTMSSASRAHHHYIVKALTYQMLLPIGVAVAVFAWFLEVLQIYSGQVPQRLIIVGTSSFALVSPIINLVCIPPYRKSSFSDFLLPVSNMLLDRDFLNKAWAIGETSACVLSRAAVEATLKKFNLSLPGSSACGALSLAHSTTPKMTATTKKVDVPAPENVTVDLPGEKPARQGLSCKRVFIDYARWCTVVCLNKIVTSVKWVAAIYAIIFVVMLGLFIFITTNLIMKYFKYPSSTELTIDVQSQKFPHFSFCNENPLKRSIVDSDPAFAPISKLMKQFEQLEQKAILADDFNVGTSAMKMQRLSRSRTMLRLLMNKLSEADRRRGGYNFTELVSECTFAGRTCSSADFTSFLHPEYGVCFTFSRDRDITKAGSTQGLRMLMTVNQDSPRFTTFDFLPTSDSANIRGVIHMAEDLPDFTNDGFKLAAKTRASIAFTRVARTRSPAPYDNCTNGGQMGASDYYANYTYNYNSCQSSCLQRLAVKFCGCVDPIYLKDEGQLYCSTKTDMLCLVNLPSKVSEANAANGQHVCDCHPACVEEAFEMIVTYGVYPSVKYAVATGTQYQRDLLLKEQNGGRRGEGDNDADDYDGTTTTTTTTLRPTTTTQPYPTRTPEPIKCPPVFLSEAEARAAIGENAKECFNDQFMQLYNNPKFTAIQGWPCISTKKCRTCIMFTDPDQPEWDWPCQYEQPCKLLNQMGTTKYSCAEFFKAYDFIPTGVSTKGNQDCIRVPTSSNLMRLIGNPLLDPIWLDSIRVNANMTPCELSSLARSAGIKQLNLNVNVPGSGSGNTTGIGGRKKRSAVVNQPYSTTTTSTTTTTTASTTMPTTVTASNTTAAPEIVTVDLPGYGSCEYANTNFKGASECIKWYTRNGLIFEMYYGSLEVRSYAQAGTYPLVAMLSDIGGHAGLWLGMSIISVVEIFALLFLCLNKLIRGKNMNGGDGPISGEMENRDARVKAKE